MKTLIFTLTVLVLAGQATPLAAHELVGLNGQLQQHQHVYRRGGYGQGLQQGHTVNPDGGSDITLWGPRSRNQYGAPVDNRGMALPDQQTTPQQGPDINIQRRGAADTNSYGNAPGTRR